MRSKIKFFVQNVKFSVSERKKKKEWILETIAAEHKQAGEIDVIFCSDEYLSSLNIKFLKHKTLTDIITFDYTENQIIAGELYISIERVCENAKKYHVSKEIEIKRVMIHGVLHLCGYNDKRLTDQMLMRQKEDEYLLNYNNIK
jgi:rRNA maturation RNase YbeY